MGIAKEVLRSEDYTNYRNVRAALVLFVVVGSILLLSGISVAANQKPNAKEGVPVEGAMAIAIVGLAGAVGGMASLFGKGRWAKLSYVFAVPYLLAFPIGTIMSFIVLSGLSRYLKSKEKMRRATVSRDRDYDDEEERPRARRKARGDFD